ncbi:prepilin peptidase [Saccharothrix sp. AJ9571]|nr:prepilin peptidase [Saccharothrix sp. AJ9571]
MVLFALLAWRPGLRPELLGFSVLAVVAGPLVVIDVVEQRLPNVLVMPLYPILLTSLAFAAPEKMLRAAAVMIALATLLFGLGVLIASGVGAGDIKLGGVLGMVTGWSGWTTTLLAVLVASTATWGYLTVKHTSSGKCVAPFGPGLLGGTFLALAVT